MSILDNPFNILKATPRDNKQRLMELCDEASLVGNTDEVEAAFATLTNPRKRLAAELRWIGKNLQNLEQMAISHWYEVTVEQRLYLLNTLMLNIKTSGFDAHTVLEIAEIYNCLTPYLVSVTINEDRIVAGFPQVENLQFVEDELKNLRTDIRDIITKQLSVFETKELSEIMIAIVSESGTENYVVVDDIMDYYQAQTYSELNQKFDKIIRWIEVIKKHAATKEFDDDITRTHANTKAFDELFFPEKIKAFCQLIKAWDKTAQPIRLNARNKGLRDSGSEAVAYAVRDLGVLLFNEYGLLEISRRIMNILKESLGELDAFAEKIDKDIAALNNIKRERDAFERRERQAIKQFELAKQKNKENGIYSVTIIGGNVSIPQFCSCCMAKTDKTENISGSGNETHSNTKRTRTIAMDFPLCDNCRLHRKETRNKKWTLNLISIILGIVTTFLIWNRGNFETLWFIPLVAALASYLISGLLIKTAELTDEHSSKERSIWFSSVGVSANVVTINFTNWFYAKLFSEVNGRNLTEASYRNRATKRSILQSVANPVANSIMVCCVVGVSLLAVPMIYDSSSTSGSTAKPQNSSPAVTVIQPKVDYPANGYSQNFTNKDCEAPLAIKTPSGDDYYYIILKNIETNQTAISIFVHPGRTIEIDVPLGTYKMYYATGATWYGTTHLFGPDTTYSKADSTFMFYESADGNSVMGHTVELIKQTNGNLSTSGASAKDFTN